MPSAVASLLIRPACLAAVWTEFMVEKSVGDSGLGAFDIPVGFFDGLAARHCVLQKCHDLVALFQPVSCLFWQAVGDITNVDWPCGLFVRCGVCVSHRGLWFGA